MDGSRHSVFVLIRKPTGVANKGLGLSQQVGKTADVYTAALLAKDE